MMIRLNYKTLGYARGNYQNKKLSPFTTDLGRIGS